MENYDMKTFLEGRKKAQEYFCNVFSKNMPNRSKSVTKEKLLSALLQIKSSINNPSGVYILDATGLQVTPTYTKHKQIDDSGKDRSEKAYFYRAIRAGKCDITDPYPSSTGLCVTVSQPIYVNDELKYVACLDVPFEEVLRIAKLNTMEQFAQYFFKISYALFAISLMAVALLLFIKGTQSFFLNDITPQHFDIKYVFEATILITLALAIFDLSKTLIEEEMLGKNRDNHISGPHKTMVKFLGSIIIALSIEALMLVFKFAITDPNNIIYAMYIVGGVAMLLVGLAIYIKFTKLKIDE